jgi:hypothetical protein
MMGIGKKDDLFSNISIAQGIATRKTWFGGYPLA